MDTRKSAILQAVVEEYITTAQPVSSQTVARARGLGVSAATVRNEMQSLEQDGYLAQPHTSAGRIPTDLGYRHFVNTLTDPDLPATQDRVIADFFTSTHSALKELFTETSQLLAQMTQHAAVVVASDSEELYVGGTGKLAAEQEAFPTIDTAWRLLELLERQVVVVGLVRTLIEKGLTVRIGNENEFEALRDCSLILAPYEIEGTPAGTIGVLGPTRMDYRQGLAAVSKVSERLSNTLS